jgi:hypothetical protein
MPKTNNIFLIIPDFNYPIDLGNFTKINIHLPKDFLWNEISPQYMTFFRNRARSEDFLENIIGIGCLLLAELDLDVASVCLAVNDLRIAPISLS